MSGYATGAAFTVPVTPDNDLARLTYTGAWTTVNVSTAMGSTLTQSGTTGDTVSFTFTGRSVSWVASKGKDRGIAEVYLDGNAVPVVTVDHYTSKTDPRRAVWTASNLAEGTHAVTIRITGNRNGAATGRRINIDAFFVIN